MDYNIERMKRELYCKFCKSYFMSDQLNPICPDCHTSLVTVVSNSDGTKITGAIEHEGYEK
jgi:Zn finger protein HypA/HybF involved in hydrogenase expression